MMMNACLVQQDVQNVKKAQETARNARAECLVTLNALMIYLSMITRMGFV